MAYATSSDVQARMPGFTFTVSTKPSTTQLTQWLVEADAFLNGALLTAGLEAPNEDASGAEILKSWAADYAEGHARMALAVAGNDGTNDSGKDILERFFENVAAIKAGECNQMLASGGASSSPRVRSYPVNNDDDLSIEDGDFAPTFTKAAAEDQF